MSAIVKICGITSVEDALETAQAGADAIGLMFHEKSPRHVGMRQAVEICRALPPFVIKVGVFADEDESLVMQSIAECGLNVLQFHGNESPEFCSQFPVMTLKAIRVRDAESIESLGNFNTSAFLLDAFSPGKLGGTGEKFNWELAVEARKFGRPIFLAGGLTPENVAEAVAFVKPYGVDVSSGVESAPGKKDPEKVRAFIQAAKSVEYA